MTLNFLIPVYNEKETAEAVIRKVLALPEKKNIIVVDDGSTDGTSRILESIEGIELVRHDSNIGKGAAVRKGLERVKAGIVIIQDADFELEPREAVGLAGELERREGAVLYGSRLLGKPFTLRLGFACNRALAIFTNILFGSRLSDVMTCYKVMEAGTMKSLRLESNGFEIEAEITAKLLLAGYGITERPVSYRRRGKKEGKKIRFTDSLAILGALLKYRRGSWKR